MASLRALKQLVCVGAPHYTEQQTPDQSGKVHIVTGGYSGCGLHLARILYQKNATVVIAGRSKDKADDAIAEIKRDVPSSRGSVEFLNVDFADLASIKPAANDFKARHGRLHVLTLNAGVMFPPKGSLTPQGHELQLGTNCLGSYLFYHLLRDTLVSTAKDSEDGAVRVSWAASVATELLAPKPGGTVWEGDSPKTLDDIRANYGQSKVGNVYLASVLAKRDTPSNVVHVSFNPGNLKTPLYRHMGGISGWFTEKTLYPSLYGGYTELWAATASEVNRSNAGKYVIPWGKFGDLRPDVAAALKPKDDKDPATGLAEKFVDWCQRETKQFV